MVESKIIEKGKIKSRIFEYFNSNNKATRKELTEYMKYLCKGEKEQKNTNNLIGKILNEETRSGKFTKERGDKNQLIFTLKEGGLEAGLENEELNDEELTMMKYEKETGKSALTTTGTLRKSFLKWKKNN